MNVSKLIWVGSCFGGLLSFASSARVLPVEENASSLQNMASQESTYETQQTIGIDKIQEFREVLFTSQSLDQESQSQTSESRTSDTTFKVEQSEVEEQSVPKYQDSSASSFFSVLPTQQQSLTDDESAQPTTTLPLTTLDVVDEAIAPVARLSRQTLAQVQLDAVVAVVPRRPESMRLPIRSNIRRQRDRIGLLPSLKAGMFEQCSQMIWDDSDRSINADTSNPGDRPSSSATEATALDQSSSAPNVTSGQRDYRVFVNRQLVAELPSQQQAEQFAETIRTWLSGEAFDPAAIRPLIIDGNVTIAGSKEKVLLTIDEDLAEYAQTSPVGVAIAWSNTLRTALGASTLDLADAQISLQQLEFTGRQLQGTASWYGPYFHGRLTASGEPFDQEAMTAAHPSLPFGTYLKVTNQENGRSAVVQINDRGPYIGERSLDLSRQAAECLGSEITGVVPYDATILQLQKPADAPLSFMALVSQS